MFISWHPDYPVKQEEPESVPCFLLLLNLEYWEEPPVRIFSLKFALLEVVRESVPYKSLPA